MTPSRIVFLLFLAVAVSGFRIFPWGDPLILYPNSGRIQQIQLFFATESKLPAGHGMRIQLPFSTAPSISNIVVYPQSTYRGTLNTAAAIQGTQTSQQQVTPYNMYFTFAADINPATNYVLVLSFATSPTDIGYLGYIQVETMSPSNFISSSVATDTPITYDLNQAFSTVEIFQAPSLPSFTTDPTLVSTVAGGSFVAPLRIKLANNFWFWPTFKITWSGSAGYAFAGCVNADTGESTTTVVTLPASVSQCTIDPVAQTLTINHNQPILNNQTVVYNVSITNPQYGGGTTLSLQVYHRYNFNLTDEIVNAIAFTSNGSPPVVPTSPVRALLSWNIDRKTLSFAQQQIIQLQSSNLTAINQVYQGIRFQFDIAVTVPTGVYQVTLQICSTTSNCQILENSIDHNFGPTTVCSLSQGLLSVSVTCSGITNLLSAGNVIGVRAWINSVTMVSGSQISDPNFGSISVAQLNTAGAYVAYPITFALDNTYLAAKVVQTTAKTILPNMNGNGPLFGTTDSNTWSTVVGSNGGTSGVQDFTTGDPGSDTTGALTGTYWNLMGGIFASNSSSITPTNLALFTSLSFNTDFSTNSAGVNAFGGATGSLQNQSGFDLIMNPNLWLVSSATLDRTSCYVATSGLVSSIWSQASALNGGTLNAHCSAVTSTTPSWTRLRWIYTGSTITSTTINSLNYVSITNTRPYVPGLLWTFFWPNFIKQSYVYTGTSLKADANIGDYYGAFYKLVGVTIAQTTSLNSNAPELGEIGGTNLAATNISIGQTIFWSQYLLVPLSVTSGGTSPLFQNINVWYTGWSNDQTSPVPTFDANNAYGLIRVRGSPISGTDFYPSPTKLALFFQVPATTTSLFLPLGPAGSAITPNTYTCFSSAVLGNCAQDRLGRALIALDNTNTAQVSANTLSYLDSTQVISTNFAYTPNSNLSVSILTKFVSTSASTVPPKLRLGWTVGNGYYYISAQNVSLANEANIISAAVHGVGETSTTCDTSANVPAIGPTLGVSGNIVNKPVSALTLNYVVVNNTYLSPISNGYGAVSWCAQWDFRGTNFAITSNLAKGLDQCLSFTYRSDTSSGNWYCVYCPVPVGANNVPTTNSQSITLSNTVASNAVNIITPTVGYVWDDNGALKSRSYCTTFTGAWSAGAATASSTGSAFVQVGQKVIITFNLNSTINGVDGISLQGRQFASPSLTDPQFPQATMEHNAECWLQASGDSAIKDYIQLVCPQNLQQGTVPFTISGVPASQSSLTTWNIIVWGMSGNAAPATPPSNLYFVISSSIAGVTVDASTSATSGQLFPWPILATQTNFTVTNPTYTRPILNARGSVQWDFTFPATRPWYYQDQLIFKLDAFVTSTVNTQSTTLKCRITDQSNVINQIFKSCTFNDSSPATLSIVSLGKANFNVFDFTVTGIRVILDGVSVVPAQNAQTIYGSLQFYGAAGGSVVSLTKSSTATDFSVGVDESATSFPAGIPTLQGLWPNPGGYRDILIGLYTSQTLNDSCRITIEFPTYYNPGLTTRGNNAFCFVDGVLTHCNIVPPRTLQIDGISVTKNLNTQFTVRIHGIRPPVITTADTFWVQMNADRSENPATIINSGLVIDQLVPALSIPLGVHVNWVNVSSTDTRSIASFTWTFNPIYSQDHDTTRAVQIIFPNSWGQAWGVFTPSCKVVDYASGTLYTGVQTIIGNIVYLNLIVTLPANRIANLICANVRTPDTESNYATQEVQIRIASQTGGLVYQFSAPPVHNLNRNFAFFRNPSLSYINWGIATTQNTPYTLPRGVYLPAKTGLPLNVPLISMQNYNINIVSPASFAFNPKPNEVLIGYSSFSTQIGTPGSTPINNYAIVFNLSNGTYYTPPQVQYVYVTDDQLTLLPDPSTPLSLEFVNGTVSKSTPVWFDVTANPPFNYITITPVGTNNSNFTVSPAYINLTVQVPWGAFVYSSANRLQVGQTATYLYSIGGVNAKSFAPIPSQTITAVADTGNYTTDVPTLNITTDSSDTNQPTQKVLNIAVSGIDAATVYFGCQIAGTWTFDQNGLLQAAMTVGKPALDDPVQGQYNTFQIASGSPLVYTFPGLIPRTVYECHAFVNTVSNLNSSLVVYTFQTPSNGGQVIRWLFNHTVNPSMSQRQTLLCTLASTARIPIINVVAENGEVCGNTSGVFMSANITNEMAVYFLPLSQASDTTVNTGNLQQIFNTTSTFASLNQTLVSLGGAPLYSIIQDGTSTGQNSVVSLPTAPNVGTQWLGVQSGTLNTSGYVFTVLALNTTSAPTALQLKEYCTTPSNLPTGIIQSAAMYYSPFLPLPSANFTNLAPGYPYYVYVAVSENNPGLFANLTGVQMVPLSTAKIPLTVNNAVSLYMSMVVAVLMVMSYLLG